MKNRLFRIGAAMLLFSAVLLLLMSCDLFGDVTGQPSDVTGMTVGSYTYTTTAATTPPVTTTAALLPPPLTAPELEEFLALVDYDKIGRAHV